MTTIVEISNVCDTCKHYQSNYESGWSGGRPYSRETGMGRCFARGAGSNDFKTAITACSEKEGGVPLYQARLGIRLRQLLGLSTPVKSYF